MLEIITIAAMLHTPVRFLVETVHLEHLVKQCLFESRLDEMQHVENMVLFWPIMSLSARVRILAEKSEPPRMETRLEIESTFRGDERMEHLGYELDGGRTVGVLWREDKAEFEDGIRVVAYIDARMWAIPKLQRANLDARRISRPIPTRTLSTA